MNTPLGAPLDPVKCCHASAGMCPGVPIRAPLPEDYSRGGEIVDWGTLRAAVKRQACQALHIYQSRLHEIIGICERITLIV